MPRDLLSWRVSTQARRPYRKERPRRDGGVFWRVRGMELATLTSKGQVTVPKAVRDALGLQQGDQLS